MPRKKHNQPFTKEGVLAYIRNNRGILYRPNQLARVFAANTDEMRTILNALVAECVVISTVIVKARCYYIQTEEQIRALNKEKANQEPKPLSKEYIEQMSKVYERCRESR